MSTHNLCYRANIKKNGYPCKPHFYYIKVGCKGYTLHRLLHRGLSEPESYGDLVYKFKKISGMTDFF